MEKLSAGGVFLRINKNLGTVTAGFCAGAVNGLLGTGGGMILIPLLTGITNIEENEVFPTSVSIILPICFVSLFCSSNVENLDFLTLLPYLIGSTAGGVLCGFWGRKIPVTWLHRILGILILWGGIRYLC